MTGSLLCLCFLVHVYVVHEKQKGLLPKKEALAFHSYFGCVNFGPFYHKKERRKERKKKKKTWGNGRVSL